MSVDHSTILPHEYLDRMYPIGKWLNLVSNKVIMNASISVQSQFSMYKYDV